MYTALPLLCSTAVAQLYPGDWPQFGRTATFQSYNDKKIQPIHDEWVWDGTAAKGEGLVASPAVAHDVVYVGSDDGQLVALHQQNGTVKWAFKAKKGIRSSPAVSAAESVVFGSYDSHVYHLDKTGRQVWSHKTNAPIYAPATIDDEGIIYVGTMEPENCLYAFWPGYRFLEQVKWKTCGKRGGAMNSGAAVSNGMVVMNNYDGIIRGIAQHSGKIVWEFKTGAKNSGGGSATIVGGIAYIGSWDRHLYALELATGKEVWKFDAKGEIESHPAYQEGVLFFTAEESKSLFALNATTGEQLWVYAGASAELNGSPSLSKEYVFFGSNDHYLYAVSRLTGEFKFKIETCGNVFSSPAIADNGMIYFTCYTGSSSDSDGDGGTRRGVGKVYAVDPSKHMAVA